MKNSLIVLVLLLSSYMNGKSQIVDINIGPSFSFSNIKENSSNKNMKGLGYSLGYEISIRTFTEGNRIQIGLSLNQRLLRYGIYLPYILPPDPGHGTVSKLKITNTSLNLGVGLGVRWNLSAYSFQTFLNYNTSLINKTTGFLDAGYNDSKIDWPIKKYTSGKGVSLEFVSTRKINDRLYIGIRYEYFYFNQHYYDEIFGHNWKVNPMSFGIILGTHLSKQ